MFSIGGKRWHTTCFTCTKCARQFEMNNLLYTHHQGKYWCKNCLNVADEKACAAAEFVNAKGVNVWGAEEQTVLRMVQGTPGYGGGAEAISLADAVTGKGAKLTGPQEICPVCKKSVAGAAVGTSNGTFHSGCFKCQYCDEVMMDTAAFTFVDTRPYHASCAKKLNAPACPVCGKPATGKCYTAKGSKIHPACFVCASCSKSLADAFVQGGSHYFCSSECKASGAKASAVVVNAGPGPSNDSAAAGPKFCPECGTARQPTSKFCMDCGFKYLNI